MRKHAHQDAVTVQQFERLLKATRRLDTPYDKECRLILLLSGRLGLRPGELTHLRADWIDWNRDLIQIPAFDPCDHGKDDGPCGYCRKQARQRVRKNNDISHQEALNDRWSPKSPHAVRTIPFGYDYRIIEVLEEFFFMQQEYPRSRSSVNRRVNRVADEAGIGAENLYPNALRATAATYHAYEGVPVAALQSMFGWSNITTAQKYVRLSGKVTEEALKETYK